MQRQMVHSWTMAGHQQDGHWGQRATKLMMKDNWQSDEKFWLEALCMWNVDGTLNAFRAEALGCLIIPIIICLAKEFIQQTRRLRVRHTCDNQGLVDQLCWLYKQEQYHTQNQTQQTMILQCRQLTRRIRMTVDWFGSKGIQREGQKIQTSG